MELNDITYKVRGAIFEVYNQLDPCLLESVYEAAIIKEFELIGLNAMNQLTLPVTYKQHNIELGFRIDILVENKVIIEIKSVKTLEDVHKKQLLTYLKLSQIEIGILVNFNVAFLKDKESIIRIINN